MTAPVKQRYDDALRNLPPSGGGGCHVALLSVANLGVHAGLSADQIASDLENHVHGSRPVTRREIEAAIRKASVSEMPAPRSVPRVLVNGRKLLDAIFARGDRFTEADLWEASPVRIDWPPQRDAVEVLLRLYHHDDCLFVGARHDAGAEHVRPVSEWIARFERGEAIPEHVIPNPLTGQQGLTKEGKSSYRADACAAKFRFAVVEFDAMARELQVRFWVGVKLPVVALLDSGGKSVHGWIRIDATDAEEWTERVECKLFDLLTPLGVDGSCKNEARLSRMPGHFRSEKGNWQRVLYLNPAGGPILP